MLSEVLGRVGPDDTAEIRAGAERRLADHVGPDGSLAVPSLARVALAVRR
jgi:hypothetical protein